MTPMMEQYMEVKNQYKDYLLFYRLRSAKHTPYSSSLTYRAHR